MHDCLFSVTVLLQVQDSLTQLGSEYTRVIPIFIEYSKIFLLLLLSVALLRFLLGK